MPTGIYVNMHLALARMLTREVLFARLSLSVNNVSALKESHKVESKECFDFR